MKIKYFAPLILFMIPTIIVSALMWPPAALQPGPVGGFIVMLISVIMTYIYGLQSVLKDTRQASFEAKK